MIFELQTPSLFCLSDGYIVSFSNYISEMASWMVAPDDSQLFVASKRYGNSVSKQF